MERRQIELRSEKVRNIIGQVPPLLLRYGITIIGVALLALVGISAFLPYQPGVDVEMNVTQSEDGRLHYWTNIPRSAMKNRAKFTEVTLLSSAELPLPSRFRLVSISDTARIAGKEARYAAALLPTEETAEKVALEEPLTLPARILFERQSVMKWVSGQVFSSLL